MGNKKKVFDLASFIKYRTKILIVGGETQILENQIKNEGILRSLIILNNLVQKEIEFFLYKFAINYTEFSILSYISQNNPTQYRIAKEYDISIQRINQIVIKLQKYGYVKKIDIVKNGKVAQVLDTEQKMKSQIEEINNSLIKISQEKIDSLNLIALNKSLKILINDLRKK